MKHRVAGRKLGTDVGAPAGAAAQPVHGAVRATSGSRRRSMKAKELRPFAERLITLSKRETLHARRQVLRHIHDDDVVVEDVRHALGALRAAARAATRGSSSSGRAAATAPRWRSSSWSALSEPRAEGGQGRRRLRAKGSEAAAPSPRREGGRVQGLPRSPRRKKARRPRPEAGAGPSASKAGPPRRPRSKARRKESGRNERRPQGRGSQRGSMF